MRTRLVLLAYEILASTPGSGMRQIFSGMDGWMDGWMGDGWMDRWVGRWID